MDTTLGIILLVALIVISAAITVYYIFGEKREELPKGVKREAISKKTTKGLPESKETSAPSIVGSLITKGKEAEPDKTEETPVDGKSLYAFVFSNPVRICAWCQAENVFDAALCEVCGMSFYQEDE